MGNIADITLYTIIRDYFTTYLPKHRGSSPHTIRAYKSALDTFLDFTKKLHGINLTAIRFEMLDSTVLLKYLDSLEEGGCSVSTRNHKLKCIRSFFAYAAAAEPVAVIYKQEISKVQMKKQTEQIGIKYMNENAINALLEQSDPLSQKGLRNQFLMLLMYDTAARVQETVDLRLCDIRLGKTPVIMIQRGKGGKAREVPLMKQTVAHFQNYKNVFHPDESAYAQSPLFYMMRGDTKSALDPSTVRKLIAACGRAARESCREVPEQVHPHMLRHSRAMHLYQHGMDLTLLSQWLGHSHLDTTLIYASADTEQKRKAIEVATPKNSKLKKKLDAKRYTVSDDETLKKLYGLR